MQKRVYKQDAEYDNRNQNTEFKRKQLAQLQTSCGISDGKRIALQNALRTNIFAEERISHPDRIRHKHRQKNHKTTRMIYFRYRSGFSLAVENFFQGFCETKS